MFWLCLMLGACLLVAVTLMWLFCYAIDKVAELEAEE